MALPALAQVTPFIAELAMGDKRLLLLPVTLIDHYGHAFLNIVHLLGAVHMRDRG